MAIAYLTNEWREWITDNLSRGCDPKSLIADMVKAGFDPGFASTTVFGYLSGKIAPTASNYVYEKPRIAAGNVIRTPDRDVRVTLRIEQPLVVFLDDVLSHEECDLLIERSRDRL